MARFRRARPTAVAAPRRADLEGRGWVLPAGYLGPPPACTRIGTIDSTWRTDVDPRGLVTLPAGWSLDWWVGADDRWHHASLEAGVRQALVDSAPVVESRLRIPGGDAIHRAFGVRGPDFPGAGSVAGDEYVVVEVENDTPVPFALALVLRPFSASGTPAGIGRIELTATTGGTGPDQAHLVSVDGVPAVLLPRRPSRLAAASGWTDVAGPVVAGEAPAELSAAIGEGPTMALLFPVTHRTTLRVVLPLGAAAAAPVPYPSGLPDAQRVASGWAVQTRRGVRVEVPDTGLAQSVAAARCAILLAAFDELSDLRSAVDIVRALDAEGFTDEAAIALAGWPDVIAAGRPDAATASAALAAIVAHWQTTRDHVLAEALLPELVALLDRAGPLGAWAREVAEMLEALGQPQAAAAVRRDRPPQAASHQHDAAGDGWTRLRSATELASATGSWPRADDIAMRTQFLAAVRSLLLSTEPADASVVLMPAGFGRWWGQGVELHDAPTAFGLFSFAVRWHGDRPAVLWELVPHDGLGPVTITAPAVDSAWSTTDLRGDALLAPVPRPADLALDSPTVIPEGMGKAESVAPRSVLPLVGSDGEPPARPASNDLAEDPPGEGTSFS